MLTPGGGGYGAVGSTDEDDQKSNQISSTTNHVLINSAGSLNQYKSAQESA